MVNAIAFSTAMSCLPCPFPQLHVVHFNSNKYSNVSVAADKSDGLAVLAVLIEVSGGGACVKEAGPHCLDLHHADLTLPPLAGW